MSCGRPPRLGHDQQQAVVARQEIAALQVHLQRAALPLDAAQPDLRQAQRVEPDQALDAPPPAASRAGGAARPPARGCPGRRAGGRARRGPRRRGRAPPWAGIGAAAPPGRPAGARPTRSPAPPRARPRRGRRSSRRDRSPLPRGCAPATSSESTPPNCSRVSMKVLICGSSCGSRWSTSASNRSASPAPPPPPTPPGKRGRRRGSAGGRRAPRARAGRARRPTLGRPISIAPARAAEHQPPVAHEVLEAGEHRQHERHPQRHRREVPELAQLVVDDEQRDGDDLGHGLGLARSRWRR